MALQPVTAVLDTVPDPAGTPAFGHTRNGYQPAEVDTYIKALQVRLAALERLSHPAGSEGPRLVTELVQLAANEIAVMKADAAGQLERMRTEAARQVSESLAAADAQASKVLAGARETAGKMLADARRQAGETAATAGAQAAAVTSAAGQRLEAMTSRHGETLQRLKEIHEVTGGLLQADAERGDLAAEVERAAAGALPAAGDQLLA